LRGRGHPTPRIVCGWRRLWELAAHRPCIRPDGLACCMCRSTRRTRAPRFDALETSALSLRVNSASSTRQLRARRLEGAAAGLTRCLQTCPTVRARNHRELSAFLASGVPRRTAWGADRRPESYELNAQRRRVENCSSHGAASGRTQTSFRRPDHPARPHGCCRLGRAAGAWFRSPLHWPPARVETISVGTCAQCSREEPLAVQSSAARIWARQPTPDCAATNLLELPVVGGDGSVLLPRPQFFARLLPP